ncbi:unnamed protein product, partial [Discosporangium mesarthrocarpum]
SYLLVGVSGALQDGFPARPGLDYWHGLESEVKASLISSALVRGYKSYLDVKEKGWREYIAEPEHPYINPIVIPSGCDEHANIYAIYAVDERQVVHTLNSEPRLLGMSPDTGLVDLTAEKSETLPGEGRTIGAFCFGNRMSVERERKSDKDRAAFLLVSGVYTKDSLVENPVLYVKNDGTEVADYSRGVAA